MAFLSLARAAALGGVLLFSASCSKHGSSTAVCPRGEAAFRLQVTAGLSSLPRDTRLVVSYQGSLSATYDVSAPAYNEDVCCRLAPPVSGPLPGIPCGVDASASLRAAAVMTDASLRVDAGAFRDGSADARPEGGSAVEDAGREPDGGEGELALQCELWTNGPASIRVTASGYAPFVEDLTSELRGDGCGVRTVDVRVELSRGDGG